MVDLAGNRHSESLPDRVTFDFTAPQVVSSVASPPLAGLGVEVAYQVTVSEALADGSAPALVTSPGALVWSGPGADGQNFRWTHTAAPGESGAYTVTIDKLCDDLGNCAENVALATGIALDTDAPALSGPPEVQPAARKVKSGTAVKVGFSATDNAALADGYPAVKLGGAPMAKQVQPDSGWGYTFAYLPDKATDQEGLKTIVIELADTAGNGRTESAGTVDLDFTEPVLTMTINPSSRAARLGEVLTVNVTSNEALDTAGVQLDKGGMALGDPSVSGTSYTWTYAVKDTDNGTYNLSAMAKDLASNAAAQVAKSVTVDGVVPTVSGAAVNPPKVKGGEQFTLTFTASEDLSANPVATFSNGVDAAIPMSKTAQNGRQYTFTGAAPASGSAPVYTVTVGVTDPAGNSTTSNVGTMEIDNVAPQLAGLEVAPAGAKVGDTLRAVLSADEALSGPPAISARSGGSTITFTPVDSTPKKISYTYTYPVTQASPQGVFAVEAFVLSDIAGNVRNVTPVKTFTVDSTVPALNSGPTLNKDPANFKAGDTVSVTFTTSEDLDTVLPTVVLNTDPQKPMPCAAGTGTNDYTCALAAPLDGTEIPEGQVGISVQLQDAAGNVGFGQATATLDSTLPSLTDSGATPDPAGLGKTLRYTVNTSEPLAGTPGRPTVKVLKGGVEQPGFLGDPATETNTSFTYVKPVAPGLDGTYTVKIALIDLAGNEAPGLDAVGFEIDATAPGFTAHDVSPSRVKAAQDVTVTFTTSETLADDPVVQLGPLPMTKTGQAGKDYAYKYTTTGAEGDGMRTVSVQISDPAGNQGSEVFSETVEFDFTAPEVASSAASPNPAKLGSVIQYQATMNEALTNTPALATTPALAWTGPSKSGLTYTWTHTVAGSETGTYTAKLDQLCDLLSNCISDVTAGMSGFSADAAAPNVTAHTVVPLLVKSGQDVTVTLTASEPLASDPLVQLGSLQMSKTGQTGQDYTYKYTTQGTEGDGTRNVTVQMTDVAGNVGGAAFAETIGFDFTNPTITTSTGSPSPAKLGAVITYSVTVSEAITNTPALTTTPALTWTGPSQSGLTYTWTHTASSGETGTYTGKLDQLCDQAANCVSNVTANMAGFAIDAMVPSVTAHNVSPLLVKSGQDVTVTLTASEPLASDPLVQLGSLAMAKTGQTGQDYTYKYSTTGAEGDGTRNVTVQMTDIAGNVGGAAFAETVWFDFTNPTVTTSTASPNPAKLGAVITYSATVSETITNTPALASTPALTWAGPSQSGLTYTWTHTVAGGESGTYTAMLDQLCDEATNCVTNVTANMAGFQIDALAPSVTAHNVSPLLVKSGQDVTVTLTASEPLASDPLVQLGSLTMTKTGQTGQDYTFKYTTLGTEGDGTRNVTVQMTDVAGNVGGAAFAETVRFDFTNPSVTTSTASPNPAKLGAVITYSATVAEVITNTPALITMPALTWSAPIQNGLTYTWTHTVAGGETNTYAAKFDQLCDQATNCVSDVTVGMAGFQIDAMPPAVTLISPAAGTKYSRQIGFNTLTVTFDTENLDAVPGGLAVTAGGWTVPCGAYNAAGSPRYTCSRTLDGADTEGATSVLVETRDAAGNQGSASVGVVFDFTAPSVVLGSASVQFIPDYPATNPLPYVTAATNNTKVRTTFTLSEAVAPNPKVIMYKTVTFDEAQSIELTLQVQAGTLYTYEGTVSGVATGLEFTDKIQIPLLPLIADAVGNNPTAVLDVTTFPLDTNAPSAPDVVTADKIIYKRVPWGSEASGGEKRFSVQGVAGAVAPGATVIVYDAADVTTALEIGRASADGNGAFGDAVGGVNEFILNRANRANVYLTAVDAAGNRSDDDLGTAGIQATQVKDVDWVSTMGSKVPGSTSENPHIFATTGIFWDPLSQVLGSSVEPAETDLTKIQLVDSDRLTIGTAEAAGWLEMNKDANKPSARSEHAMAYDSARGKVVLFGGCTDGSCTSHLQDTWEWDGMSGTWTDRTPAGTKPRTRSAHSMVYDSARGRIVLFGGFYTSGGVRYYLQDIWEWDGAAGTWTDVTPTGAKPSARYNHSMVYDSARGRVLLFGGFDGARKQDAWEWEGTAGTWTERTPAGTKPSARFGHAMAFDSTRGRVVLFGGDDGASKQDTWEWDGATGMWTDRTPTGTKPSARDDHTMAYDSTRGRVVIFSGDNGGNETWEWEGAAGTWTDRTPAGTKPSARERHAMVFDSAYGRVVLFGGEDSVKKQDTWEWDGAAGTWTERTPTGTKPSARERHAMAYDSGRERATMFGGFGNPSTCKQDLWEWDGAASTWTDRTPGGTKPSARYDHTMAYDTARGRVFLFGGNDCTTFKQDALEWNGATGSWTDRTPGGTKPSARWGHAMAYDSGRGRVVLFGGSGGGQDTWEWDGTAGTWTDRTPAGAKPSARYDHAMAYDSARGRVVLFGGSTGGQETWEWDGAAGTWIDRTPGGTKPSPRALHAMVYDMGRGRSVVFGGNSGGFQQDIWEWDGAAGTWTDVTPAGIKPSIRGYHAMAYESGRGRVVMWGGYDNISYKQDTWEWDGGGGSWPSDSSFANLEPKI
ncbi:MAG: hypothetical protein HY897_12555 [Deltaproteobacteria bacterium]|nr:hypothetical protein [Deltaproteobacteria bacterium]